MTDQPKRERLASMSLGDHLEELRTRLILALVGLAVGMIISFFFGHYFVKLLMVPFQTAMKDTEFSGHMQAITVAEPFMVYIKAVLVLAALISSPWLFYQLWAFISAGLYKNEQRYIYRVLPFSVFLFVVGVVFFIFIIAPMTMKFFITFNLGVENLEYNPQISDYINLILILALVFGLMFQIPLVIVFAERMGLIELKSMKKYRKYVVLGAFIAAAMATPTGDMVTQTALAIPLYILYEGSVFYCGLRRKKESLPEPPRDS